MIPDVLGYELEEGIRILAEHGVDRNSISVCQYLSPKGDMLGNDQRIVRVDRIQDRITLVVSYF